MKALAIFTAPKPFTDPHIDLIQRNAIASWRDMGAAVDVLLIGDETGAAQAAKELGVTHVPEVAVNAQGTPLVSSIFDAARAASDAPLLAYVNADILLFPETLSVALDLHHKAKRFALMGQRYDLDVDAPIDFAGSWPDWLRGRLQKDGRLHPPGGSDYFIFPRELYTELPDFAIGRAGWDNWMIYHAVTSPWPAVDGTAALDVVHQNHDYGHLDGGEAHYRARESEANAQLAGGMRQLYTLLDVKHEFRGGRLRKKRFSLARLVRSFERRLQPQARTGSGWRWALLRQLRRWRRALIGASN